MGLALHNDRHLLTRPLELKLSSYAALAPSDLELIRAGVSDVRAHRSGSRINLTSEPRVVLAGWVAVVAQLMDGRRQIMSLALPGDLLELPPNLGVVVGPVVLEDALIGDARALVDAVLADGASSLASAWRLQLQAAVARRLLQVLRLGRLSAYERVASLLLELHQRQRQVGLADETSMPMPLTQESLADALGLSAVHLNRTMQQLRRDALIVSNAGHISFPDPDALARAAMHA